MLEEDKPLLLGLVSLVQVPIVLSFRSEPVIHTISGLPQKVWVFCDLARVFVFKYCVKGPFIINK